MDRTARAWQILESAELIHSAEVVDGAIARVAAEIDANKRLAAKIGLTPE